MESKKNFLSQNKKQENTLPLLDKIENIDTVEKNIDMYGIELNKISAKLDLLTILASKIKSENEKTNSTMTKQEDNIQNIDVIIKKQINIINKLSEDINIYKYNLDTSMENFNLNKEKLLYMVKFIKEMKIYILNIERSSNNMKDNSDSILNISKTIKNISNKSKLLSINAQIEAAKIADRQNGFGVISNEMVKMADNTKENSALIDITINDIIKDIEILNKNIQSNTHKIEDSIKLCIIIINFVEELTIEYKSNITMFDGILTSMSKIATLIKKINDSILDDYKIANDVFRNTSTEHLTIDSFIQQSNSCKKEINIPDNAPNTKIKILDNEKLKILTEFHRDFNYDPINTLYTDEGVLCKNIYDNLFEENITGTLTPILAKGWNDENARVWTIYLKNNVYFSNGQLLTAEDIEFSIIRTFVKGHSLSPNTFETIEGHTVFDSEKDIINTKIKGIEVINDTEIKITLKREDILFLNRLSSGNLFIISKKEYLKNKKTIGTGAYYIASIENTPDNNILMKLKSNIYNYEISSYIKEIDIYIAKDFTNKIANILKENHDFDIIYPLPFKIDVSNTHFSMSLESDISNASLTANFIASSKNKLIKNKDFRQSIFAIINNIDLNIQNRNDYFFRYNGLSTYWYSNNLKVPNWLDKNPTLKTFSGELNIVTYNSIITTAICEKIKIALENKGLKVNIHIDSFEGNLDNFDLIIAILNHDTYDIYSQLFDVLSPPLGSYLIDTELGERLENLTTISNYKEKNDLLEKLELDILKEYYNLPIAYTKQFLLKKNNILNLSGNHITELQFGNLLKTSNE